MNVTVMHTDIPDTTGTIYTGTPRTTRDVPVAVETDLACPTVGTAAITVTPAGDVTAVITPTGDRLAEITRVGVVLGVIPVITTHDTGTATATGGHRHADWEITRIILSVTRPSLWAGCCIT